MTDDELIELQIRNIRNKTTLPKPRRPLPEIPNSEVIVLDPEVEEEVVIQQAERFVRTGRPQISMREAEQIADFFIQKNISRELTIEILKEYNLYDEEFELNLQKIPAPAERAMIIRLRAMRIIREQEKARGIRPIGEVELEDFGANIDIYDPWINSDQKNHKHKIITDPFKSVKKYDAIVVAVSHKQFKAYTTDDYSRLSSDIKVIIDIKNIVEKPTWRM